MDMTEVLRRVKTRFGDDYDVIIDSTDIVDWANEAIREIIREAKCYTRSSTATSNTETLVATDLGVVSVKIASSERYLRPTTFEDLIAKGHDLTYTADEPDFYYVKDDGSNTRKVYVWPVASPAISLVYSVIAFPSDVTSASAIAIPTVYHNDIVTFCIARAHERNQNYQAYNAMMQEFNSKVSNRNDEWDRPEQESYPVIRDDPYDTDLYY